MIRNSLNPDRRSGRIGRELIYGSRLEMSVAELVRIRGQKSHDFCYRNNQIAYGMD